MSDDDPADLIADMHTLEWVRLKRETVEPGRRVRLAVRAGYYSSTLRRYLTAADLAAIVERAERPFGGV